MAYDERLAQRIRAVVEGESGITEKRMFGGLAFLVDGRMAVAAGSQGHLMVRVDPAESDALTSPPHVRRMLMRGRELAGWLTVEADVLEHEDDLRRWVAVGTGYAGSLPA